MALNFMKSTSTPLPTLSFPETFPIAEYQPFPARPITSRRVTKRARESSPEDLSDDIDGTGRRLERVSLHSVPKLHPRDSLDQPGARLRKKRRLSGPDAIAQKVSIAKNEDNDGYITESLSDSESETVSKPPTRYIYHQSGVTSSSEYSRVNSLLKNLHISRSNHTPAVPHHSQLHSLGRAQEPSTSESHLRRGTPSVPTETVEVGHAERDAVKKAYEEVNHALGKLILSRYRNVPQRSDSPGDGTSDSDTDSE
ncbi:hypothetical protein CPB86DRAFT_780804 [Serendipita vermifera]|nr:hypothetical protein CPB86DRAFT_780804 [Serendipita vermifera]